MSSNTKNCLTSLFKYIRIVPKYKHYIHIIELEKPKGYVIMKITSTLEFWCRQNNAELLLSHYIEGNNDLPPDQIGFSSSKLVNFRCPVCNLSWTRSLNKATRIPFNQSCPYCSHRKPSSFYNLASEYPDLMSQWDWELNSLAPESCLPTQKDRVYWQCDQGHQWNAVIRDRVKSADTARKSGTPLCPYCSGQKVSPTYNLITEYPDIARRWNYRLNQGLKPEDFSPVSGKKVWWTCDYNPTHQWQASIGNRTLLNRGCPFCAKEFKISYPARALFYYLQKVVPDCICEAPFQKKYKIDLLLPSKQIAIEHDGFYYHGNVDAQKRSHKKDLELWKAGYQVLRVSDSKDLQQAVLLQEHTILYRFNERCAYLDDMVKAVFQYLELPLTDINHKRDRLEIDTLYYHERKKHSLAAEHPELAKEWSSRNTDFPDTITSQSNRKILWICPNCKQEYTSTVVNRVRNHSGCPYCANLKVYEKNSLAALNPDIAAQWHPSLNGLLTPDDVVPGTPKKVHWICPKGHVWIASVSHRTRRNPTGCPICSHRLAEPGASLEALNPDLAKLWHPTKNLSLLPSQVTPGSSKSVWWKCRQGHEWQQQIKRMKKKTADQCCPYCYTEK